MCIRDRYYDTEAEFPSINTSYAKEVIGTDASGAKWVYGHTDSFYLHRVTETDTIGYLKHEGFLMHFPNSISKNCYGELFCSATEDFFYKYDNGTWISHPSINNIETCEVNNFLLNPYTCDFWAYDVSVGCNTIWNVTEDFEIDIIPSDLVRSMAFDSTGNLYACTRDKLIVIDSVGRSTTLHTNSDITLFDVVYISTDGTIWIIGNNNPIHEYYYFEDNTWKQIEEIVTSVFQHVNWFYEDSKGNIWLYEFHNLVTVSYTHLTLPTILRV